MNNIVKLFCSPLLVVIFLLAGCQEEISTPINQTIEESDEVTSPSEEFLAKYNHISWKTRFELLHVMIATAKYHNIERAIKDGYADIDVVMPNMGYHYMKSEYVDDTFEVGKPELLVYSKNPHNGKMRLVAVEYAVPIELTPDSPPDGFTGNADVWSYNTDFGLWLLHAWVWKWNPDGVFNPTNPLVP
jgi:hypothetical protein